MHLEDIRKRARADLAIPMPHGEPDVFLWEHVVRVAGNAKHILRLPEVGSRNPDEIAVFVAALYHEAGWLPRLRSGEIDRGEILVGSVPDSVYADAARFVEESLAGSIPSPTLERAAAAIRARNDRRAEPIEAQVLAEADNLEEFGLMFLWPAIRRGLLEGKGIQAVLDIWSRRKEYSFWTAKLNESFRFAATRNLAAARLEWLESVMNAFRGQQESNDVRQTIDAQGRGSVSRVPKWT